MHISRESVILVRLVVPSRTSTVNLSPAIAATLTLTISPLYDAVATISWHTVCGTCANGSK